MSSSTWGTSVAIKPWTINLDQLVCGESVNIVVSVLTVDVPGKTVLGTIFPGSQRVRITGFESDSHDIDSISIYGAIYKGMSGLPSFAVNEFSKVMTFPKIEKADLETMIEFCAGMGIATIGFAKSGFDVKVAVEIRPKMADLYAQMHFNTPVVTGDVCNADTIFQVWKEHPRSSVIFSGFACQPYSKGGKQLGVEDQRSSTLRASLEAAFMLRAPVLILECVKEACSNTYVQQEILTFCSQCRFHKSEIILSMEDCWPVRRERWWIVLTAQMIGLVQLRKCPILSQPSTIGMIMNGSLHIPDEELSQLEILEEEYERFLQFVPDIRSLYLKTQGKAPTALHAWGAQVLPCPCECRAAFSDCTLATRGIYGVVIPIPGTIVVQNVSLPRICHPHPCEVAAWNCVPFDGSWPSDLRLVLTGLGQMATPVHAAWISPQVKMHIEQLLHGAPTADCHRVLDNLRMDVLMQCKTLFQQRPDEPPCFVESIPRVLPVEVCSQEDIPCVADVNPDVIQDACPWWFGKCHEGSDCQVTVVMPEFNCHSVVSLENPERASAADVITGETKLSCRTHHHLVDCSTKMPLNGEDLVAGRCVALIDLPDSSCSPEPCVVPEFSPISDDGYMAECSETLEFDGISPTLPFTVVDNQSLNHGVDVEMLVDPFPEDLKSGLDHSMSPGKEDYGGLMAKQDETSPLFEVQVEPLCKLNSVQLLQIQSPMVSSLLSLDSFCNQTMPNVARIRILENQGSLMGDDEIRFHAFAIMETCLHQDWFSLTLCLLML